MSFWSRLPYVIEVTVSKIEENRSEAVRKTLWSYFNMIMKFGSPFIQFCFNTCIQWAILDAVVQIHKNIALYHVTMVLLNSLE